MAHCPARPQDGDEDEIIRQIKSAFRPDAFAGRKQILLRDTIRDRIGMRLRNLETAKIAG